jgi:hypothetical protein
MARTLCGRKAARHTGHLLRACPCPAPVEEGAEAEEEEEEEVPTPRWHRPWMHSQQYT